MPLSRFKKSILVILAASLFMPAVLFGTPQRAYAIAPVADVVEEKNFWADLAFGMIENGLYFALKGALKTLAEGASNQFMDFMTGGLVGRQKVWEEKDWKTFGIDLLDQAAGGAAEGYFLTLETMDRAKEAGIKDLDKDARRYDDLASEGHKQADEWSEELTKDWEGFDCQRYVSGGMTNEEAEASPGRDGRSIKDVCGDLRGQFDQQLEADNQADQLADRATAVRTRIGQFNAAEGDRFVKYQRNRAGALSPGATSILRRACNPSFGLEFNIGLALAAPLGAVEPPICRVSELFTNWTGAIQGTGVAISDVIAQTGRNPWQTLVDAIDPRKSNVGVALTIHQNIIAEQEQVQVAEMMKRWLAEQEGFKPVVDLAGNIMTPAPFLKKVYEQQVKNESDVTSRLTGKAAVDAADLVYTFVSTLIGNTTKLYFDGLRKKANEVNQLAGQGFTGAEGEFNPQAIRSDVIYTPDAAPQYVGAQEVIARRSASLAQVKTTSGEILNILAEFQAQDCKTFPNACTLGPSFARAIQEKLTIADAMKKFSESGGSVGLNPLGVFGYTSRKEEPSDFRNNYPYHSMVVLRKYRVLPVAWELAALYLKDHPDECSGRDCTLQDVVNGFNNSSSAFYRLIDPSWVLKLPEVRCELKGYGPAALKVGSSGALQEVDDSMYRPEVCVDERSWLHEGTPEEWRRAGLRSISNEDYGYCVEEKKVFSIKGTQCRPEFASCDTFAELDRDGKTAKTQFYLKDSLPPAAFAAVQSTNVCKAENAGCSWLSKQRRQYETCAVKITRDTQDADNDGLKDEITKRELLENKTLKQLWVDTNTDRAPADDSWRTIATYQQATDLCGTIREERPDGSTFTLAQEWTASSTERVFLSYKAQRCEAEFEGCRDLGSGDYLKIAPSYLECDEEGAWQRGECQRYALHCTPEAVGCQLYNPVSRFESPVTATTPLACVSGQCVDLNNYLVQPSFFKPTETSTFHAFKASAVQSCNAQSSGCEEFTNLAQESVGSEARTYFTKAISCEQKAANERTVFYSYFGSEKGGRQPAPYYLKPSTNSSVPDCVSGYTCTGTSTVAVADGKVVCDNTILAQQYNNTSTPLTCREFIASDGTVSYRLIDKLIYQADDCAQYRRTEDQQVNTYSPSLSTQCASQYKGCRTYVSTQAGNYRLAVRDVFDQSQGVGVWQVPEGVTEYEVDTSLESENVGGRSMRIKKKSGTPTSYEVQKSVTVNKDYTYTFTLTARAQSQNTVTAAIKGLDGSVDANLGSYTFGASGWQYITFTATSSPANSTSTSALSLVFSKGSASTLGLGPGNSVYIDNIYLKEASGKTVYAIDTSIATEAARPSACRTAGSTTPDESDDIYQTGCQFYNDRNGQPFLGVDSEGKSVRVAHYGFQNVCPAAFVGCRGFKENEYELKNIQAGHYQEDGSYAIVLMRNMPSYIKRCATDRNPQTGDASPNGITVGAKFKASTYDKLCYDEYIPTGSGGLSYGAVFTVITTPFTLVDEPSARCAFVNNNCTAYGYPKNVQEGISVASGSATTTIDVQTRYTPVSKREEWQTVYYKITPEQIAASSTAAEFANGNAYKGGICKQEEIGCKAYDTATAKRYFKDPGKNVCQFYDTNQGDPRDELKKGGWFYKACGKISENYLNATTTDAIKYPFISCRTDADCAGLNSKYPRPREDTGIPVYTEKCDSYISCGVKADQFGVPEQPLIPLGPYSATSTFPLPSASAKTYWMNTGPVSYAKQCTAKVSGCTEYQDPDCSPCGPNNEYCIDPDPKGLQGTLISDYGRYNPSTRGQQGSQCKTKYYYIKSAEKTGTEECRNVVDVENGCVLFRSTGKDSSALTYSSKYYYDTYFASKRGVTVNRADTNNTGKAIFDPTDGATNNTYGAELRDANVVLKANLDRACNVPLICADEVNVGDKTQCLQRLPCLAENEVGGCASIAFSGKRACKGAVGAACATDSDCAGVTGATFPVQCVPVGVCNNDKTKRCTETECGTGNDCVTQNEAGFTAAIKEFCQNKSGDQDSCNENIECFWNESGVAGNKCLAKDSAALQQAFLVPKAQPTPATAASLDLSFTMLSGYAHPNLQFNVGERRDNLSRDSFFDWNQSLSVKADLGGSGTKGNLQNVLDTRSYQVANSCRLYPRSDASYRVGDTNWSDACNYVTGGIGEGVFRQQQTLNIGLYGYCLEPYPQFRTKFEKQWKDNQSMQLAQYKAELEKTVEGSYELSTSGNAIYNPYRYACLLWNPVDKLPGSPASGTEGVGASLTAYEGSVNNIYLCTDKADGGTSAPFDTQAATSETHYIYEDVGFTGSHDKTYVITRDSSTLKKSGTTADIVDDAGKFASKRNIVIATAEKNPLWIATGVVGAVAACGATFIPVVGAAFASACLGTAAVTLVYALDSGGNKVDYDVSGYVDLNSDEKLNGNGLHMDAIAKIEYTVEGARRDEFVNFFSGNIPPGGNGRYTGSTSNYLLMAWEKWGNTTFYKKTLGLASDTWKDGKTLYNTRDSVKNPVAFYFDENTSNRENRTCDPMRNPPAGGGTPTAAICAGGPGWYAETFYGHGCSEGKNFVVIGPEIENNRLKGWKWRYCDSSSSSDKETVAISIKIKFQPYTSDHTYKGKNIYGDYCSELVRPTGDNKEAIGYYKSKLKGKPGSESGKFFTYNGKTFLIGSPDKQNTRLYFEPKIQTWETDTWYTTTSGSGKYLRAYPEALSYTNDKVCGSSSGCNLSRAIRNSNDTITQDTLSAVTAAPTSASTPGYVPTFPQLKDSITTLNDLRTTIFGKVYEKWRSWDQSYASSTVYKHNTRTYEVNTNNGHWASEAPADRSALEGMWDTSKTNALPNAPAFYAAEASSTVNFFKRGSSERFTFEHNKKTVYQKVEIQFYVDANDDQLPLRKLMIDWGDFPSGRSVLVPELPEGRGIIDRAGPTVFSTIAADRPYLFKHVYRDSPVGKTICLYAMDNWEAKSAVCGTVKKDPTTRNLFIGDWVKKAGSDYDISSDPVTWPPRDKGRCKPGGTAHDGTYPATTPPTIFACPF